MNITVFTKPKAIITLLVAALFLLDANLILQFFGIELNGAGIMVARILGGVYLGAGIGFWKIKDSAGIDSATANSYALGEAIAAVACLIATQSGAMNALGWLLVFAYGFFAIGFVIVAKHVKTFSESASEYT